MLLEIFAKCTVLHLFECNQLLCSEVACPSEHMEMNRSLFRLLNKSEINVRTIATAINSDRIETTTSTEP